MKEEGPVLYFKEIDTEHCISEEKITTEFSVSSLRMFTTPDPWNQIRWRSSKDEENRLCQEFAMFDICL